MRILKHILAVMIFMVTMSPCGHADVHFNSAHDHDHDAQSDLCSVSSEPCDCHACDTGPCDDDLDLESSVVGSSIAIADAPVSQVTISSYPSVPPVTFKPVLQKSGTLVFLRTVQLLI